MFAVTSLSKRAAWSFILSLNKRHVIYVTEMEGPDLINVDFSLFF